MPTPVSPRILIVDDEAEITEILADLLSGDYDCSGPGPPKRRSNVCVKTSSSW